MHDIITEFKASMANAGCPTDTEIMADDVKRRFHIIGDKRNVLNGTYQLAVEGSFGFGWFRSFKDGITHKWYTRGPNMSAADQAALKEKIDKRRATAALMAKALAAEGRVKAERIWAASTPARADHPYLVKKGVPSFGLREYRGLIVVPAVDSKGISTLQFISGTGEKRFIKDSEKKGCYFTIPGSAEVAVCEGYATGATIHMATGWTVRVCFDAGNLPKCADGALHFCADDDRFTFRNPADRPSELPPGDDPRWTGEWASLLKNPGIEAAKAALKGGSESATLKTPKFKSLASRPTDFNDLHALEGLEEVRRQLTEIAAPEDDGDPREYAPIDHYESMERYIPVYDPEGIAEPIEMAPFKIMGHNHGQYYYLPRASGQLVNLSASGHSKQNLMQLAPLAFWQERFGTKKGGVAWDVINDNLIQMSHTRGIFKMETMLRGSGVWLDRGRVVVHCGDRLLVDGETVEPFEFPSAYVYQKSSKVYTIGEEPLNNLQAHKLYKIFSLLNWRNPTSALLAAGWTVIAPFAGALKWRPHIYIDGEKGSGKSWVNDAIIKPALGTTAIRLGSGTTEAGLRRMIGNDARPIVMDEMEGEDKKQQETRQAILLLARKASSGESVVMADSSKGTETFTIYSIFSMSSINTGVKQGADARRFTHLDLLKNNAPDAVMNFRDIQAFVKETLTEEYAACMVRRTLDNLHTILKNAETFSEAAATLLRDRGAGDQLGAMLAGAYSLHSTKEIDFDAATEWIKNKDWSSYTAISDVPDHQKLYDYIMTSSISVASASKRHTTQVGKAIQVALGYVDDNFLAADARNALESMDIKVRQNHVWIRKPSQHIVRLLSDTPWEISWAKSLQNIDGIQESKSPQAFGASSAKVIMIPVDKFKPEENLI